MRFFLALLSVFLCLACGSEPSGTQQPVASSTREGEKGPYEQFRSGSFQLVSAVEALDQSLQSIAEVKGQSSDDELNEALGEAENMLASAGGYFSDYASEPPSKEEFDRRFAELDELRIKAIEGANDAIHETRDAQGILDSLLAEGAYKDDARLQEISDLLGLALDSLADAIRSFGGQVEEP